jgi:ATP-dependent DNA helicase RecQ
LFALNDEERRLLYVGMTRARDRLWVCDAGGRELWNPTEVVPVKLDELAPEVEDGQLSHSVIGPKEIWLDAAGSCRPEDPIHAQIAATPTGARVHLVAEGERVRIEAAGLVGRLSKEGSAIWIPRLPQLREVRVLAWVHRKLADVEPAWKEKMKVEDWEYPILSVWWFDRGEVRGGR